MSSAQKARSIVARWAAAAAASPSAPSRASSTSVAASASLSSGVGAGVSAPLAASAAAAPFASAAGAGGSAGFATVARSVVMPAWRSPLVRPLSFSAAAAGGGGGRPSGVGIVAMETYIGGRYVEQEALEKADGVSAGKYTLGLGQKQMAFVDDREDINSICMTAVQRLLDRYGLDPRSIGRLEVGTESLLDKSKSTKTTLMPLLAPNADVEGATVLNACYGGTAAFFNSCAWVESSEWDGRYALFVAGDIAVYAPGAARPTGGVGAVAALVGPGAPLRLRPRSRATHAVDVYDFYKPALDSEYPSVDGKLSQACYLRAVDDCYSRHMDKAQAPRATAAGAYDYLLFHSPYNKLVQQSYRRMLFNDARRAAAAGGALPPALAPLAPFVALPDEATYTNKELDRALAAVADADYARQVTPGVALSQAIGNSYTGALWANLACLVDARGADLAGARVGAFSYGSGALATMFALDGAPREEDATAPHSLAGMRHAMELQPRLAARRAAQPDEFAAALMLREAAYGKADYTPKGSLDNVPAGAWFLDSVCDVHTRKYARKAE